MSNISYAQINRFAYGHSIEVKDYEGCFFRLIASVRTEIDDDSASAKFWARVETKSGTGFYDDMRNKPIRDKEWKTYTIEGKIDSGAINLFFGAVCQFNGRFYFDDYTIEIENPQNHWEKVFTDDFRNDTAGMELNSQRWWKSGNVNDFKAEIYNDERIEKDNCLLVTGKGVPIWGINSKAGKFANVNGIQLYYEMYGEGQPLVMLHGNNGSIGLAGPFYPYFIDKKYRVIAVDSRAHGKSGDSDAELTYDLMASDINELLDQLGIDSVYLFGHSDGAIIGLILAMKYPDKIKKLIAFGSNLVPDTTAVEPLLYQYGTRMVSTIEDPIARKRMTLALKYPNIPFSDLNTIQCEVLIMSGDRDFIRLSHTIRIFENIPKSNLCIIPGATHMAPWEKKDLFLKLVTDFFETPFRMPGSIDPFKD